jgi:hypothetical protein
MRNKMVNGVNTPMTEEEEAFQDAQEKKWEDGKAVRNAMAEIRKLESQITNRRLREAYKDSTWLDAQEALIKTQRDKL